MALARALINKPEVLLLDEPLGALDLKLRRSMQLELKRIQTEVGITFVHVTHDQEEAMTMADTIAVMNAGVIEQMGAPDELYENPRTTFVANFLGQSNLIEADIQGRENGQVKVRVQGASASVPGDRAHADSGSGWLGIRPEKVLIAEAGQPIDAPGDVITGGHVTDVSFVGVSTQYMVTMPWGQDLMVFEQNTGSRRMLPVGTKVDVSWHPEYAFLLDASQDVERRHRGGLGTCLPIPRGKRARHPRPVRQGRGGKRTGECGDRRERSRPGCGVAIRVAWGWEARPEWRRRSTTSPWGGSRGASSPATG